MNHCKRTFNKRGEDGTADESGSGMLVGGWNLAEITAEFQMKKIEKLVKLWAYLV